MSFEGAPMDEQKPPTEGPPTPTGPRGGTTTVTAHGHFRTSLWLTRSQSERLRQWAFKLRRSKTELIRMGIERLLRDLEAEEHGTGCEGE
jgi:hypothetical protein